MDDPLLPRLEHSERRRRSRTLFRHRSIPVRLLVPNFFTLLSLCAGLTAIRMAIESRYEMALGLIVVAALLDGIDGRVARLLKAQSKFGAELDSLADFANFGVAPALVVYTWGLDGVKGFGWIAALLFALATGLRLARFNAMLDVEKPKWQSNYFTGVPAPAGAIAVMLPLYLEGVGLFDARAVPQTISAYLLLMAFLLVSTIPTYSGKLLGERVSREWVLPVLVAVGLSVALLVQYPYGMLTAITLGYLALLPFGWRRYRQLLAKNGLVEPSDESADEPSARKSGPAHVVALRDEASGRARD